MIDLIILLSLGIITGILIGLFPVFPIYFGAFLLYLTSKFWTPESMLLFWIVATIGSQFFSSVSAITLSIPGDASSLVYIDQIKSTSLQFKNRLLWLTSRGSLIGGLIALCLVWTLYHLYQSTNQVFLAKLEFKLILLYSVIVFLIWFSEHRFITTLLAAVGVLISPQNNYSLPVNWYYLSEYFQNITFFMLVLSLIIIPDLVLHKTVNTQNSQHFVAKQDTMPWSLIFKNSLVGCIIGLVPGPAAELSASVAYNLTKDSNVSNKIIASETANNSGVVMMLLPLLLLGLPFTASSLIVSNIMDTKLVELPELARSASSFIAGASVFDSVIILASLTTIVYYFLSIKFIDIYVNIVSLMQGQLRTLLITIVLAMIVADIYIQQTTWTSYIILLTGFTVAGLIFRHCKISAIPLIFIYLLGDQIIWSTQQFFTINF